MIETRLLHYFLAIAREQSITRAAQTLFLSQSTLSKQMMDLERQLGKQLFHRGKRRITLTEGGVFLRNRAQEILELLENTEAALHTEGDTLRGDLSIACGETAAMDRIAGLLEAFHAQYPEVKLHTYSGDADAVLERIDKGLSDLGLLLGPVRQEKYEYLNLHQKDVYGLLMPRDCPLARQESIPMDQLKTLPMILADQTFFGHQDLDWFGEGALHVVATYNLIYNATFLVARGLGVSILPRSPEPTYPGQVVRVPIEPPVYHELALAVRRFVRFAREWFSAREEREREGSTFSV